MELCFVRCQVILAAVEKGVLKRDGGVSGRGVYLRPLAAPLADV